MSKAGLVIVDVQKDFCQGGALAVKEGDQVVPVLNRWISSFVARGLPVAYTQDWHPKGHCSFSDQGGVWPAHCVQGEEGAAFHPALDCSCLDPEDAHGGHDPRPDSVAAVFRKGFLRDKEAYSGFDGRLNGQKDALTLGQWLRSNGVTKIYVGGLATDYCVKATLLDGIKSGFDAALIEDGVRAVNVSPSDGERAIGEMAKEGAEVVSGPAQE